jgi:hypothetical protein
MAKQKKQLKQTHGAAEGPKSAYEIIGYKGNVYKTNDVEVYKKQLLAMNFSDLHEHAISCDVVPIENRELLTTRLVKEFLTKTGLFHAPSKVGQEMSDEKKKKALDILSRGK